MNRADKIRVCQEWIAQRYPRLAPELVERLAEFDESNPQIMHRALLVTEKGFVLALVGEYNRVVARCEKCSAEYDLSKIAWAYRHAWTHKGGQSDVSSQLDSTCAGV